MEQVALLVAAGAKIATPLSLAGAFLALFFGAIYKLIGRMPRSGMQGAHWHTLLQRIFLYAFVIGVICVLGGLSTFALNEFWAKHYFVAGHISRAIDRLDAGDHTFAQIDIESGLNISPNNEVLLSLRGEVFYDRNDFQNAEKYFRLAFDQNQSEIYLYNIAAALFQQEKFKEAYAEISKMGERTLITDIDSRYALSVVALFSDRLDESKSLLCSILGEETGRIDYRPKALLQLGILEAMEQADEFWPVRGVMHFRKSLCLKPALETVYRGISTRIDGDLKEDLKLESRKIQTHYSGLPEFVELLNRSGNWCADNIEMRCDSLVEE